MLLEWTDHLNIGVPEIDAEHRYLVALVNNLHDDFSAQKLDRSLPDAFAHLTQYVTKHFRNEEALMAAAGYPGLRSHIQQHENLTDELSELAEDYMAGKEQLSAETMEFLKTWLVEHVMEQDQRIGAHLSGQGVPTGLEYTPAYANASGGDFKACSCCDRRWKTFNDLAADDSIQVLGGMPDSTNHLYNIIIFNCTCGTTLAIPLTDFIEHHDLPFQFEDRGPHRSKPGYCLRAECPDGCLTHCACAYTDQILKAMGYQVN